MKNTQKIVYLLCLASLLAIVAVTSGCSSPVSKPSRFMTLSKASAPSSPPAGKSLVVIHRPKARQGYPLYTGIWDSKKMIADLGNGHSVAYVCNPGKHHFINRSVEVTGVIEADLAPDKAYDLWVRTAGAFIASFKIEPLKPSSKDYKKISQKWEKGELWVEPIQSEVETEMALKSKALDQIIQDFVYGDKKSRVQTLSAGDHR
jgi:hypothetical protein